MASAAGYGVVNMGVDENTLVDDDSVFFVGVTGILCSGVMALADIWDREFVEGLLVQAGKAGYKTLYVAFFDPLIGEDEGTRQVVWRKCIRVLSDRHTLSRGLPSYVREYNPENFPVDVDIFSDIKPENKIIIDLAHIFNYSSDGRPFYGDRELKEYKGAKVIYPGYIGPDINYTGESVPSRYKYIMLSDIFYDHATGKSYIDMIIDVFGKLDVQGGNIVAPYPWDTIDNFLKENRLIDVINPMLTKSNGRFKEYEHFMKSEEAMKEIIACLKTSSEMEDDRKDVFLFLVQDNLLGLIGKSI